MKRDGRELIAEERERQQTKEGWDAGHDDEHELGELGRAAYCYEKHPPGLASQPLDWPWQTADWKPKDRLRNLVRAGALYQAEIDRLCRRRMNVAEEIDALLATLNVPEAGSGDTAATEAQSGVSP